jgi:hypothetical protein
MSKKHDRFNLRYSRPLKLIEGFAIFVAVFVVASVGSWNDYKKEE